MDHVFEGAQQNHHPICIIPAEVAQTATELATCCEENNCNAPVTAPAGYTIATPAGTTVSGLGALSCAATHVGGPPHPGIAATASCPTDGGDFAMSGCIARACVAPWPKVPAQARLK